MDQIIFSSQLLCFIIIVLLFFGVGKRYGFKISTKELSIGSILVILSVVLSFFSLLLPILGVPGLKIGFAQLPLVVAGFVVSPFVAILVGLITDLIGLILVPTSFPFLGFTLNSIVLCLIPALIVYHKEYFTKARVQLYLQIVVGGLLSASALYLVFFNEVKIGSEMIALSIPTKIGIFGFFLIITGVLVLVYKVLQKRFKNQSFLLFVFMVIVMEILVNLAMTPLWLSIMYGTPYLLSLFLRIVKASVMIPLHIFIGYSVLQVLLKITKKDLFNN